MTFIQGTTGQQAEVNDDARLEVSSVSRTKDNFINAQSGKVWSLAFAGVDPAGAADKFMYLKNTGADPIRITDIRMSSTVAGIVSVKQVSGSPTYVSAAAIPPLSRRTGRSPALQATANTDTNITGLTDEGTWFYLPLDSAGKENHLRTSSNIIIDPGGAVALEWDTSTGIITGTLSIVENGVS